MMPANPPFGMVFACFMVAIMIGSSLYTLLLARGYAAEDSVAERHVAPQFRPVFVSRKRGDIEPF